MARSRKVVIALTGAVAIAVTGCSSGSGSGGTAARSGGGPAQTVVNIGYIADQSGPSAGPNKLQINGMNMALEKINASGKYKIVLHIVDSGGDPSRALADMRQFASDKSIMMQIGPANSNEFIAAIPSAGQLKLPTLSIVSGAIYNGDWNDYAFRTGFPENTSLPHLIDYAKQIKAKSYAMMYAGDNDYAKFGETLFAKLAKPAGLDQVASESFALNDVDFSAQVAKVRAAHPDVVYVATLPAQIGGLLKAMRAGGITQPILVDNATTGDPKQAFTTSGGAAAGVVVSTPFDPFSTRPLVQDFMKEFAVKYPNTAPTFEVYGYDGALVINNALSHLQGPLTRDNLRKGLASVDTAGLTGSKLTFPQGCCDVTREGGAVLAIKAPGVFAQTSS